MQSRSGSIMHFSAIVHLPELKKERFEKVWLVMDYGIATLFSDGIHSETVKVFHYVFLLGFIEMIAHLPFPQAQLRVRPERRGAGVDGEERFLRLWCLGH